MVKSPRRARNTGGLRQKSSTSWEGRLRVRREDGSFIEKSFTRNSKTECQEIINMLRGYEPLENNIIQINIDRYTNNITLIKEECGVNTNMLFGEYMDYFIWEHRRFGVGKTVIKDTTLASYIDNIKLIKKKIGNRKMVDLKYEDVKKALEEIHLETCDTTAKKVKNLVYSAFSFAKKDKVISNNILADNDEIHFKEKKGSSEKKIIAKEDEEKFIRYCLENKEYLMLFLLFTGTRKSEACGVKWENIDFDKNIVTINQAYMRVEKYNYENGKIVSCGSKKEITDLKSKAIYRVIGLPIEFVEILREYKESQKELAKKCGKVFSESDLAFTNSQYGGIVADIATDKFRKIMNAIKIKNYDKITIHSLRHTYCSIGIRNGVGLKEMQKILGHSSIAVTANIYSHLDNESVIKASNKVSNDISKYLKNEEKN